MGGTTRCKSQCIEAGQKRSVSSPRAVPASVGRSHLESRGSSKPRLRPVVLFALLISFDQ